MFNQPVCARPLIEISFMLKYIIHEFYILLLYKKAEKIKINWIFYKCIYVSNYSY